MTRVYHVEEFRPTGKYECIACHTETEDAYIIADNRDEANRSLRTVRFNVLPAPSII
jgi:hypothetical protein